MLAATLAPPCTTFSVAQDRTSVIRTKDEPWGIHDLNAKDAEKVKAGNQRMRSALRVIHWLEKHQVAEVLLDPNDCPG